MAKDNKDVYDDLKEWTPRAMDGVGSAWTSTWDKLETDSPQFARWAKLIIGGPIIFAVVKNLFADPLGKMGMLGKAGKWGLLLAAVAGAGELSNFKFGTEHDERPVETPKGPKPPEPLRPGESSLSRAIDPDLLDKPIPLSKKIEMRKEFARTNGIPDNEFADDPSKANGRSPLSSATDFERVRQGAPAGESESLPEEKKKSQPDKSPLSQAVDPVLSR